jgi:Ca2+-binding EF-hand superfamily protein
MILVLLGPSRGISQFPGGGSGGGGRGMFGDPSKLFDMMSGGKDVATKDALPSPFLAKMFDGLAEKMGITNGVITRDQFNVYMQQAAAARNGGAPAGGSPNGNTPDSGSNRGGFRGAISGAGGPGGLDAAAEGWFRQLDKNGDGVLNYDEMPENLRVERDKWDMNHDGVIDLHEFKEWFKAFVAQRMNESNRSGGDVTIIKSPEHDEEDEPKPVVYRAGKLPKELPAWFKQIDTDGDGQITMAEWRAAGKSIEEFQKIDRNGDGFLTIAEVLYYVQGKNYLNGVAINTPTTSPGDRATATDATANGGGKGPGGFSKGGGSWGDMFSKGKGGGSDTNGDPRSQGTPSDVSKSDFSKGGRGGNTDGKSKGGFGRPASGGSK